MIGSVDSVDANGNALFNGVKFGEYWKTDVQVAILAGNRREDDFFQIRVGKSGSSMPFVQAIPTAFSRSQPTLLGDVILQSASGHAWSVAVRPHLTSLRFGKGWRQFVVENGLREGHLLLFTLDGPSHFAVQFFNHLGKRFSSEPACPPAPGAARGERNGSQAKGLVRRSLPASGNQASGPFRSRMCVPRSPDTPPKQPTVSEGENFIDLVSDSESDDDDDDDCLSQRQATSERMTRRERETNKPRRYSLDPRKRTADVPLQEHSRRRVSVVDAATSFSSEG